MIGSFAAGVSRGIRDGRELSNIRDQGQMRRAYRDGIKQAEAARVQDIESQIRPAREGGVSLGYMDGTGKVYGSREEARQAAEGSVGNVMDYFMKESAPKIQQKYMELGQPDKAASWGQYIESDRGKRAIGDWSKSFMDMQTGNWKGAADGFGKYYSTYVDDSMEYRGHELVKDDEGNVTGFRVKLHDKDTGNESETEIGRDEMVNLGMTWNPQTLFSQTYEQQAAAAKMRAENAAEIAKEDRGFQRNVALEGIKSGHRQQEAVTREQASARYNQGTIRSNYDANVDILRQAGISDDRIRELTPRILGIADQRASMSDTDVRVKAIQLLNSGSGAYQFNRMSNEEKEREIEAMERLIKAQSN